MDYKDCMTQRMREIPKGLSRDERGHLFCVAAKQCSGKAKTAQEAEKLCNQPKPPKEPKERKSRSKTCPPCPPCSGGSTAKKAEPEKPLTCADRRTRVLTSIDNIMEQVKLGEAADVVPEAQQVIADIKACHPEDTGLPSMAANAFLSLKEMSKGYYFKGEIKDLRNQYDMIRKML